MPLHVRLPRKLHLERRDLVVPAQQPSVERSAWRTMRH
jgi:hypothetical protein